MNLSSGSFQLAIEDLSISYCIKHRLATVDQSTFNRTIYYVSFGLLTIYVLLILSGCSSTMPIKPSDAQKAVAVIPVGAVDLHVDHAWVKDASTPTEQAVHRKTMEALREKIEAGGAFIASWNSLGVDGTYWHVAEKETYSADVIPEAARNLPIGSLSPILPGDGGLHLFRILGREPAK